MDNKKNSVLHPGDLPGFQLTDAILLPELKLAEETWSNLSTPSNKSSVELILYPVRNTAEALEVAEDVFQATTEREQIKAIGKPTPGSFSGQPIGDVCWAYTVRSVFDRDRPRTSSTIVVVQGNCLFRLRINTITPADDAVTERIAKIVIDRLKHWARPQFPRDNEHGRGE